MSRQDLTRLHLFGSLLRMLTTCDPDRMTTTIPKFLLPRGIISYLNGQCLPCRVATASVRSFPQHRYASASAAKPRVLEKPTRFNPPSHGRRLKERMPRNYGPSLTKEQKVEQDTKQYPSMMPPKGTFMHWFLTNRSIHVWITMVYTCSPSDSLPRALPLMI